MNSLSAFFLSLIRRRRIYGLLLTFFLIALFTLTLWINSPPREFPVYRPIEVTLGSTIDEALMTFYNAGALRSILAARLIMFVRGDEIVRAGTYYFREPVSLFSLVETITQGRFGLDPIRIRVPEGANNKEIADIISRSFPSLNKNEFLQKARSYEGMLYPDTYFFLPTANVDELIRVMTARFFDVFSEITSDVDQTGRTLQEIIIMASILEKEASRFEDKRKIAGVLWKRLDAGMPLQVDATFLYFLGKNTYELTYKDLNIDSPYNTYRYSGLPPTAISNPTKESLQAAIYYDDNPFWYYLSDRSGVVYFSETYEEHLKKKKEYVN